MKKSYEYVANKAGEETARRLCELNARAALEGTPMPAQPEPIGLWEQKPLKFDLKRVAASSKAAAGRKNSGKESAKEASKSFWNRLFAR